MRKSLCQKRTSLSVQTHELNFEPDFNFTVSSSFFLTPVVLELTFDFDTPSIKNRGEMTSIAVENDHFKTDHT